MHLSLLANRAAPRLRRYMIALVAASLLAGFAPAATAVAMQDVPPNTAVNPPKPGAAPPASSGSVNAPGGPDQLAANQLNNHSWVTDREQLLSYAILIFGLAVLVVQYLLLRSPKRNSYEILQLLAINLIVTGTLFLISAGFSAQQISPGLGLFGTIAGYVLGRRAGDTANADSPPDNHRGAP